MQYHVIDLANIPEESLNLVNNAFILWKQIYGQELSTRGLTLPVEDFWNARLLAVIEKNGEIIGSHLYNVFDIRSLSTEHKYFHDISNDRLQRLHHQQTYKIMSMEYLLVNPAYRGSQTGIRWGEVVIGLGFQVLKNSPWHGAIGVARMDKNVHSMSKKMGGREGEVLTKNQTPCTVMTMNKTQMKNHEDVQIQSLIDKLWSKKNMTSPWDRRVDAPQIQAA